ncbi:hypothetical protein [Methylobacterium sp. A52T]
MAVRKGDGMSAGQDPGSGPPPSAQSGQPIELYPMTDIRFVMMLIGDLNAKVDRLIADVGEQNKKLSDVRDKITFVRGAVWVLGGLMTLLTVGLGWYLKEHLQITLK